MHAEDIGTLPRFAKSWRSRSANALWSASVLGLQAIALVSVSRDIFKRAGLPWRESTAKFIRRSTIYRGPYRYFGVMRDAKAAASDVWHHQLNQMEQMRILDIVHRFPVAHLVTENSERALSITRKIVMVCAPSRC